MPGSTTFRAGDVAVEISDGLEQLARRAAAEVAPGVLDRMESVTNGILDAALEDWPVRTGESSRGLYRETSFEADEVGVAIRGIAEYTPYVRPAKWYGAETAWSRLVQKPMAGLAEEEVERLIGAAAREALDGD